MSDDTDSSEVRPAKYETVVHPSNRHAGYGIPVTVYATSVRAARERAIQIGWSGRPGDASVVVKSVHDTTTEHGGLRPPKLDLSGHHGGSGGGRTATRAASTDASLLIRTAAGPASTEQCLASGGP